MPKNQYVISYLGMVLELTGMLMIIPIIVSGLFGEGIYYPFLVAAIVSFAVGTILDKRFERGELDFGSAMLLASLSFIIVSVVGAVPYLPYLPPIDAFFESVSGFTTTGLTTVLPEQLPRSILFWRSLTQWLGGLGILLIFMLFLPSMGISSYYLYKAEGRERIEAGVYHSMRRISVIYLAYTLLGFFLFALVGVPIFDAGAHSMTAVSTGGFSTRNNSLAAFQNPGVPVVACILMILGATSFIVHDRLWGLRFRSYLKNPEARLFWIILILFSGLLFIAGSGLYYSLFHALSAMTTTGFTISGISGGTSAFLLLILMLIGGFAGSTAGGLKLIRVSAIVKGLYWYGKKLLLPKEAVVPFKMGQTFLRAPEMLRIFLFVLAYIILLGITTVALSLMGYPPLTSFFQAASAQGTVGMSLVPIASLPATAKLLLIVNMLLGRLEIFPFLALVMALFGIKR
jgi:trk system potassium uptake protein TrkH